MPARVFAGKEPQHEVAPPPMGFLQQSRRAHLWIVVVALAWIGLGVLTGVVGATQGEQGKAATALLIVQQSRPSILDSTRPNEEYTAYQATQRALLSSPFVIRAALEDPKVAELPSVKAEADPIEWIGEHLRIEFKGELMAVSFDGGTPEENAAVANAVVDSYLNEVVNKDRSERLARIDTLRNIYEQRLRNLEERRKALREQAQAAGVADPQARADLHRMKVDQLGEILSEARRLRLERTAAEVRLARRREQGGNELAISELEESLAILDAQVKALQEEAESLTAEVRDQFGRVALEEQATRDEIEVAGKGVERIAQEIERLTVEVETPMRVQLLQHAHAPLD